MIDQKFKEECKNYNQFEIDTVFVTACMNGNLDRIKYLFNSSDINFHPNINVDKEMALRAACMNGHLEVVKYLVTSEDLKKHANICFDKGTPLAVAAINNNLHIVKYFLETPQFKKNRKYMNEDTAFMAAYNKNHLDIISYFIYERNIKKPKFEIGTINKDVNTMFDKRDLKNSLDVELSEKNVKNNKVKL